MLLVYIDIRNKNREDGLSHVLRFVPSSFDNLMRVALPFVSHIIQH